MVAMVRCRKRLGIGVSGPGTARVPTGASHVHQPLSNNRASRPPNPAFGPIAPDNEVLSGPQRPLFSPRGSNLPLPPVRKAATAPRSARRRAFQDAPTPLTRRVDSHQLVGPHLTTAKRDARRPRGIEYVSVRIHHAPQSNGGRGRRRRPALQSPSGHRVRFLSYPPPLTYSYVTSMIPS